MKTISDIAWLMIIVNQMSPDARKDGILILALCCILALIYALILLIRHR